MKILISTAVYYPQINGVAVFSHSLAVGLAQRGHEVAVICPSQNGKNHTVTQDGVKVHYLKSVEAKLYPDQIHTVPERKKVVGIALPHLLYRHGFRVSVFPRHEVRKIMQKFQPDVVHVQVSDPIGLSVVAYARKNGIPVVTTEHNQPGVITEPLRVPGLVKKPINALLASYFRNRQGKSDFVTMPTEQAIRDLLAEHELKIPIAAISNGVDLEHFRPGRARTDIYKKYNLPRRVPIVLYVGRVDPEKQVGLVLKAYVEARKRVPQAEMVVVGDGVDKQKLEQKYKNEPKVHFLGRVLPPDLYELYKIGSVFVTASEIETQGIVLIEAAATGLPLVAVNSGAVSEVCVDGENGYLCRPGDVSEMADAIAKILSDQKLSRKYSENSLKIAHEHDFETTLDKFENIYRHLIYK